MELGNELTPFLIYFAAVLVVVVTMLGLSYFLGQRVSRPSKDLPYESGIVSVGSAHFRISVHFYLPAILFIIFDLEIAFLFPWAIVLDEIGVFGFWAMMIFLAILVVGFVYEWMKGALEWE